MMSTYQIPFDNEDGNQLHYPETYFMGKKLVWKDNYTFEDTLIYKGYSRGRSAAYFNFRNIAGKTFTMFLKDFDHAIKHMVNGAFSGTFTFTKRGQNYGVKLIGKGNNAKS